MLAAGTKSSNLQNLNVLDSRTFNTKVKFFKIMKFELLKVLGSKSLKVGFYLFGNVHFSCFLNPELTKPQIWLG